MGSSNAQKLPQPGQGAERNTSGAWHLRGNDAVTDETRGRPRDHDDGATAAWHRNLKFGNARKTDAESAPPARAKELERLPQ